MCILERNSDIIVIITYQHDMQYIILCFYNKKYISYFNFIVSQIHLISLYLKFTTILVYISIYIVIIIRMRYYLNAAIQAVRGYC